MGQVPGMLGSVSGPQSSPRMVPVTAITEWIWTGHAIPSTPVNARIARTLFIKFLRLTPHVAWWSTDSLSSLRQCEGDPLGGNCKHASLVRRDGYGSLADGRKNKRRKPLVSTL